MERKGVYWEDQVEIWWIEGRGICGWTERAFTVWSDRKGAFVGWTGSEPDGWNGVAARVGSAVEAEDETSDAQRAMMQPSNHVMPTPL